MTHQNFGGSGVRKYLLSLFSLSLLIGAATPKAARAADSTAHLIDCEQFQTEDPGDVKKHKRLRTLTTEYWEAAESRMSKAPVAFQKKGFVVGDFHFANLGLYYDYVEGKAQLVLNDLDDAGTNYLLGDLTKFLVYLRSVDEDLNFNKIIDAYVKGLNQETEKSASLPPDLRERLEYTGHQNQRNLLRYIEKRKKEAEQFNSDDLTPNQSKTFSLIESLPFIKNSLKIDSTWINNKGSGSSRGMERYLFLATNRTSQTQGILEFKQLRCSATGPQDRQDLKATFLQSQKYLRDLTKTPINLQSPLQSQSIFFIDGRYFLSRVKLPNLLNDLDIESSHTNRLEEFAKFYAHYLGFIHSHSSDAAYRDAVANHPEFIIKEISSMKAAFKKSVKNASR